MNSRSSIETKHRFDNFWSNVSAVKMEESTPRETQNAIVAAAAYVQPVLPYGVKQK